MNKQPIKFASLHEVRSAIAAETARPAAYLQSMTLARGSAVTEAENLTAGLDPSPANIAAIAAAHSRVAGLSAAITDFETIGCEHRGRVRADTLCRENKETIGDLLDAGLATFEKSAPSRFEKWRGAIADLAKKAIGRNPDPEAVRLAQMESEKIQVAADELNYSLAAAKCGIQNFRDNPSQELFEAAAAALQSAATS